MNKVLFWIWMVFAGLFFAGILMGEIGYADELQLKLPGMLKYWWVPVSLIAVGGSIVIGRRSVNLFLAVKYFGLMIAEASVFSWICLQVIGIFVVPPYLWLVLIAGVLLYSVIDFYT